MPELPDLAVFAQSLRDLVLNRRIKEAVYHRGRRLNVEPGVFCDALKGERLAAVNRVGKALVFELGGGDKFLVHLMLSGGFQMIRGGQKVSYPVLTIEFDDGDSLVLSDPRGLATITWNPDLKRTALDALEVTKEYLQKKIAARPQVTVKELLIDQSVLAGIGNAYSDEILWQARIAPTSIAGKLPEHAVDELVRAIPRVLEAATDYLRKARPGMISGELRDHLAVHKPKAKQSPTGAAIKTEQVASNKTYYTEEQVLYR